MSSKSSRGTNICHKPNQTKSQRNRIFSTCQRAQIYSNTKTKKDANITLILVRLQNITHLENRRVINPLKLVNCSTSTLTKRSWNCLLSQPKQKEEEERQLLSKHSMQVQKPNLQHLHDLIQMRIKEMYSRGSINKDTLRFLKKKTTPKAVA